MFCCALLCVPLVLQLSCHHDGEERTGCFDLFVFLVPRECCVSLPRDAMGLSAVCNCVIS